MKPIQIQNKTYNGIEAAVYQMASPCNEQCPFYVSEAEQNSHGTVPKCEHQDVCSVCYVDQLYLEGVFKQIQSLIRTEKLEQAQVNQLVSLVFPLYSVQARINREVASLESTIEYGKTGTRVHAAVDVMMKLNKQIQDMENKICKEHREKLKSKASKEPDLVDPNAELDARKFI